MDAAILSEDRVTRQREEVFRTMFWHEETYSHRTETLLDGWRCLDCDAKMSTPPSGPGA